MDVNLVSIENAQIKMYLKLINIVIRTIRTVYQLKRMVKMKPLKR